MLRDLLVPGLKLVVCGTAASSESAKKSFYYAGPGNKFWKTLFQVGLTDRELTPAEYKMLLAFGIGLTDVVKGQSGMDVEIDFSKAQTQIVKEKILKYQPRFVCFNGKRAAQTFLRCNKLDYGLQATSLGSTKLFIAPSTSGAANGFWNIEYWQHLSGLLVSD